MSLRPKKLGAGVLAGVLTTTLLAGCGGSASQEGSPESIEQALEEGGELTYWSWTPSGPAQVAAFEEKYPNVSVKLVNAGTGDTQYTRLQNAIKAGSGGPDVAQIEYYAMPQFEVIEALADLEPYGFADLEDKYSAGTWGSVTSGEQIFGLPQDSGPMALFYNKSVFDEFGLAVPTTWEEYIAEAAKLNAADPNRFITSDNGDAGFTTSMIWQAGGRPFEVSGEDITINLQDEGSMKWANTWNELVENKLLSATPGFSDDWYKQIAAGQIASFPIGAWLPSVLQGSVEDGSGDWRVAPMPTYDGGAPTTAENGGGAQVVMQQSENQALAAGFLRWLNSSEESVEVFLDEGGFPSTTAELTEQAFLESKPEYFGQQPINTLLSDASTEVSSGFSYLPYQLYANSIYGDTVGQAYENNSDLNEGLIAWQEALVEYGNAQGFTVTEG